VDAWSLTNLDKHTGRPEIAPWLRGWVEDVPEVTLVWRRFLPWRAGERAPDKKEVEEFFEHAAPVRAEMLEAPLWRAAEVLKRRAEALRSMDGSTLAALVLDPALALDGWMTLADLSRLDAKRDARLAGHIVVVASFVGGLSDEGLLDEKSAGSDSTAPGATQGIGCTADGPDGMRGVAMRIALGDAEFTPEPPVPDWVLAHSWAAQRDDEGTPTRLLRVWEAQRRADPALARRAQSLACHTAWVVKRAEEIAQRLNLPAAYRDMLVVAARLHDLGKATERWQRAFGAPADGVVYGKTAARRINHAGLDGYRHEFGSVILAPDDPALGALAPELRDLALHLIAAHHGRARPILEPRSADVPPGRGAALATETALRFARLQRQWGPWGLAWWESLLRLADAAASAELERPG
jgi:CRISPR-associated endonuclease/helicase Cas3